MLQIVGRPPAELASGSYYLLNNSLPSSSARVCFMIERGLALPLQLNNLLLMPAERFFNQANANEVRNTVRLLLLPFFAFSCDVHC